MMKFRLPAQWAFLVHSLRLHFLVWAARQGGLLWRRIVEEVPMHDF
jgi:hypothetical protein